MPNDDGVVLCRVDSATIKEAIDVRRRWNARYNQAESFTIGKPKTALRTVFDEIGSLPKPNWSFVVATKNPDEESVEAILPIETTLSAPHLFVVSGSTLTPMTMVDESEEDLGPKAHDELLFPKSVHLLPESSSSLSFSTMSDELSSSEASSKTPVDHLCQCSCSPPPSHMKNYPVKLLQKEANLCVSYKILENAVIEIGLQSYKGCKCSDRALNSRHYGPWTLAISKSLIKELQQVDADWKKKVKLRGPMWPPEEFYRLRTSPNDWCLRESVKKKKVSEVLEYIMDTNTDKFHSEPPITVRLAWFMEEQLKNTQLVNSVYDWNTDQVLDWLIVKIGLPQYAGCFETNGIRGRHLVFLDAEGLEKMGIRDFDHILKITSEIRKMFKIQREKNVWRDVMEARYDPLTLHAMYNCRSVTERMPVYDFFINNHFINRKVPHYSLFELPPSEWDIFPRNVRTAKSKFFFEQKRTIPPAKGRKQYEIVAKW